ncbi:Adenosine receptor A2a [Holothuria leucospilota]|uniref:Adenosine receptor A2a n=1 Tax=Holothuria leucospilota TaxID=206669 RepID=A0A9Q1CHE8_HOLLE|nr:Adenosine receptor A2a [Holothuria leucospilota]
MDPWTYYPETLATEGGTQQQTTWVGVSTIGVVIYILAFLPIWIAIIFGNLLVIFAFKTDVTLQKSGTNIILYSLAATDLLSGLVGLPLHVIGRVAVTPLTCSSATRALFFLPGFFFCGLSLGHIFVLAVERYVAVSRPITHRRIVSLRRIKTLLTILWLILLVNCFLAILTKILATKDDPDTYNCDNYTIGKGNPAHSYEIFVSCLILFFFLLMALCYVRIYFIAREILNRRHGDRGDRGDRGDSRKRIISTTSTTAIVVVVCGICWLPTIFKYFCRAYCNYDKRNFLVLFTVCEMVLYSNSMVNPIIYGYRMPEFRKAYRKVLDRVRSRQTRSSTHNAN